MEKNTKKRLSLASSAWMAVLLLSTLLSCSESEDELFANPDKKLAVGVEASVQTVTDTKAAVSGRTFPANTTNVFRLTAFAAAPSDWSTPYFDNIQVNSGVASALTLNPVQYYPVDGRKLYFYGYAPSATSLTKGTGAAAPLANYTITGQEDIMAAQETTGISAATITADGIQIQPTLPFTHKLMQLKFKIVKDESYEAGKKVTGIEIKAVRNSAKLNIATGALVFEGTADKTLSLPITAGTKDEIVTNGTEMNGCVMLEPASEITLKVVADGVTYDDIAVRLVGSNAGQAGVSHLVTLTFKRVGITTSATITAWEMPVDKDLDVDGDGLTTRPRVGYYYFTDGSCSPTLESGKIASGLIYYVDPNNPLSYKVVSLAEWTAKVWAASTSYVIGSGAQSDTDGRGNSAAIKAAWDAKLAGAAITESTFEAAFPAAAECYNYTGKDGSDPKGTWCLPAKSELQYLWCAFNGVTPPISWEALTNAAAPADLDAQKAFNKYLTDADGVVLNTDFLWSSSEYTVGGSSIFSWCVRFSDGQTPYSAKNDRHVVRCSRDVTIAPSAVNGELKVDPNGLLTVDGKMALFRFGSVVGFAQEGAWGADKVLFNPVTGSPSYADYSTIPNYTSADWDAGRKNVSAPDYHHGANVKVGKGDPCKLAGLTGAQIRSMSTAQLDAYRSGWRLPTNAENYAFSGQTGSTNYSAHWTASDMRYDKLYYSTGSAGAYFPKGSEDLKQNYLPAIGCRSSNGAMFGVGIYGYYWSSELNSMDGFYLYFNASTVIPSSDSSHALGVSVRCIKDEPLLDSSLKVDPNGILTIGGTMAFFQFGSVVGFAQEGAWAADKVLFNPVTGSPSYADYTTIPSYTSADWDASRRNVSALDYHHGANIKGGKGDPCRLVGLTAAQIRSMSVAQLDVYRSGWRLPTTADNFAFSGQTENGGYTAHWTASDMRYDKLYYSTGSVGAYFPKGSEALKQNYLPATGYREVDGSPKGMTVDGNYLSCDASTNLHNYYFGYNNQLVHPNGSIRHKRGLSVRCVKDKMIPNPPLEVDQNGILTVGGKMLFIKFGGVVGFTQEGAWGADKVLFNPVTGSPSYADYTTIPVYASSDYPKNVSDPTYHTGTNIKAGKGDPCKLAGLSAAQIQAMTAAQLNAYNSGWRLPTNADNQSFTGVSGATNTNVHSTVSEPRFDKWYYSTGSAGAWFPSTSNPRGYFPFAGYRETNSTSVGVGNVGYCWSGHPFTAGLGNYLHISTGSVDPLARNLGAFGFGVRCVKDPVLEVDQNGVLMYNGKMLFFQSGSVVGFTQEGAWGADKVLFNPGLEMNFGDYANIPRYSAADFAAQRMNISAPDYHNGANVKAGKGDPCKLVGLSALQIKLMTTTQINGYYSGWRLPTTAENIAFSGQVLGSSNYTAHWTDSDSRFDKWYYSTGSAGGYFPKGQESQKLYYLPAAGDRKDATGTSVNKEGALGIYWSSTVDEGEGLVNYFAFDKTVVNPKLTFDAFLGVGVRCVKDTRSSATRSPQSKSQKQ